MSEFDTFMPLLNESTDRIGRSLKKGNEKANMMALTIGFIVGYEEGQLREARCVLMRLGDKRLGPPGKRIIAACRRG